MGHLSNAIVLGMYNIILADLIQKADRDKPSKVRQQAYPVRLASGILVDLGGEALPKKRSNDQHYSEISGTKNSRCSCRRCAIG